MLVARTVLLPASAISSVVEPPVSESMAGQSSHFWIARHALWPPNASEFEMALFATTARPVFGI